MMRHRRECSGGPHAGGASCCCQHPGGRTPEFLASKDCGLHYSVQLVTAKVVIAPGFVTRESQGAFYSAPPDGVHPLPRSPQNRQTFSFHL